MRLRARLLVLSISTVAGIVTILFALHLDSLTSLWLNSAMERNDVAGKLLQAEIVNHIADSEVTARDLDDSKRQWTQLLRDDKDLADKFVEQTALPSVVIAEINVVGEDGRVVLSSIPSRQGQDAPHRRKLTEVRDSGFFGRLSAIAFSKADYETRVPIGIPDQVKPIFEVQLLVSPILLWDKVRPGLVNTAYFSLLALLAAGVLAALSAQIALRPLRRIGRTIDTLTSDKPLGLSYSPPEDREDREVAAVEYKLSLLGEKMQEARQDADRARSGIGVLARVVAHEIKNPLNAISLRLESLRMRVVNEVPEAESEIDLVGNEVQRLDRVVRTFLDLNRPMELEIAQFDPADLVARVLENTRPAATQARVKLELARPEKAFVVQADRGHIERCVVNLVNNAIQACDGMSGALVRTSVSLVNGTCEVAVTDNGPGMPASVQERIFEPYFTTKASGSGIGLAVTRRAMELHRGTIGVKSAPNQGTVMILSFPILNTARSRT